jgi:Zn-finger nucleic acid-binding protein
MMEETESVGMVCPNCRVDLVMAERHGVEIDYCPKCRGVWLDRGELDKIVEKAVAAAQTASQVQPTSFLPQGDADRSPWGPPPQGRPVYRDEHDDHQSRNHDDRDDHNDGRRGGWLGRLLD